MFEILPRYGKYKFTPTHLIVFLGAELDKRRVNFLIDSTTHDADENLGNVFRDIINSN
jgi:hypothetical protein